MKIGIIDNDFWTRKGSHYPNLAAMKISGYHKSMGDDVVFMNINDADMFGGAFDKIYLSKVFTDTYTPDYVFNNKNIEFGGTGFYYDKAKPLELLHSKVNQKGIKHFTDFSIGFRTRGCIRKCQFCVNKNSNKVLPHSDLSEFVDNNRKYIMLWDDNITAYSKFESVFDELNSTGKPFVFKQGMDFRLLNKNRMSIIFNSNYYSQSGLKGGRIFHFAFDDYSQKEIIEKNLKIYYENKTYSFKVFFYVLTGFDRSNKYNDNFFIRDVFELLERIRILSKWSAYPYVMLHEKYKLSPYNNIIHWIKRLYNFPAFITNKTLEEALVQSGQKKIIEDLTKLGFNNYLGIKFNSKLYKHD